MRDIVSPLAGFSSPFGRGADPYAILGYKPPLVLDYENSKFRVSGSTSTAPSVVTATRTGLATQLDASGNLVWNAHNLALNSATPATQSITVVSGADYTVECTGSGSITLSGAGTGSVTEGNPVEITASTTTLTLTVVGSLDAMWAYRSDLGGMAPVPLTRRVAGSTTYVPTTSAAVYLPREEAYAYVGGSLVGPYYQKESDARTNLLHTTNALVTQTLTVTAVPHTLHFTGTGTVTLSGVSTAGPLVGTGTGENNRVSLTFTPTAGSLTLTVSGTVSDAQLEVGSTLSSYIPNLAASGTVTRSADSTTIAAGNMPYPTPQVIGPELVTNGTFDTDTTGWTARNAVITQTDYADRTDVLSVADSGIWSQAWQEITTVSGKVYQITVDVARDASVQNVLFQVYDGSGPPPAANGDLLAGSIDDSELSNTEFRSFSFLFVAASAATVIAPMSNSTATAYFDNISVREINPLALSFQLEGLVTGESSTFANWTLDANNGIQITSGASDFTFTQEAAGVVDSVTGGSYTSGVNTPFNFASTHASTLVAAAVDGTSLTPDTTPTALPDLSATTFDLAPTFNGFVKLFRVWSANITAAGREEAST